ncbi:nuclear transport factor 2 family protein [Pantoea sp. 18069]|uniref:nuclear transport factor 2 family protein n=1 Tax=Pantoea sp. 18069 TaxID=2681415 RepID=UPI001356C3C9|nr:nuclear transport factor 2 family protein [Pantoea sp. 18069]
MPLFSSDPRMAAVVTAYEALRPETVPALLALYSPQARFKDPFNEVQGRAAIGCVFQHMFDTLGAPRFIVGQAVSEGDAGFLTWEFLFERAGGARMCIRGATHLHFAADGSVDLHRDYWDAAEELYAKLPVLGVVMRALQKKLAARPR